MSHTETNLWGPPFYSVHQHRKAGGHQARAGLAFPVRPPSRFQGKQVCAWSLRPGTSLVYPALSCRPVTGWNSASQSLYFPVRRTYDFFLDEIRFFLIFSRAPMQTDPQGPTVVEKDECRGSKADQETGGLGAPCPGPQKLMASWMVGSLGTEQGTWTTARPGRDSRMWPPGTKHITVVLSTLPCPPRFLVALLQGIADQTPIPKGWGFTLHIS